MYLRKEIQYKYGKKNLLWNSKFLSELWLLEFQEKQLGYMLDLYYIALLMAYDYYQYM